MLLAHVGVCCVHDVSRASLCVPDVVIVCVRPTTQARLIASVIKRVLPDPACEPFLVSEFVRCVVCTQWELRVL